ncbi:MAG: TIM barrel protein [Planctomycetes bacterium]|nr:TIM barrel protein [Planctomycetota bacterium]
MSASRRQFLATSAGLAGLAAFGCGTTSSRKSLPFRISLAEWSLHRTLGSGAMTNLDFPRIARAEFGIEAIEYVNSFFKDKARDKQYLDELSKRCDGEGVKSLLIMIDGEGELAHADEGERKKAIANHERWLDCAAYLGCHSIRVNAGGGGDEAEKQKRAADSLVALATKADSTGLNVIVENHGGSSSKGDWLAGVMKLAAHPRVGTLPDFGNFNLGNGQTYDRYKGVEELMPFAKAVSAKSHEFDARGNEVHTDYSRMMRIVLAAGYSGFVGIEYEGSVHEEYDGIRLTKQLLERLQLELAS